MARAAADSDVFNAIAEARRREILSLLVGGERSVSQLVDALELQQPAVSKHLRVLHDVGLVRARRDGRRTLYRANAQGLRPVHDWTSRFERHWRRQLDRIKERAERRVSDRRRPHPVDRGRSGGPKKER